MALDARTELTLHDTDLILEDVPMVVQTNPAGLKRALARTAGQITVIYKCEWDKAQDAATLLLGRAEHRNPPDEVGGVVRDPSDGYGYIHRTMPHSLKWLDPDRRRGDRYICTRVSDISGVLERNKPKANYKGPAYEYAYLTCLYEPAPYEAKPDDAINATQDDPPGIVFAVPDEGYLQRFVSKKRAARGRTILTRPGWLVWANAAGTAPSGNAVMQGAPLQIQEHELMFTWYSVPDTAVPYATQDFALGTVNSATFSYYAAGYLLMQGVELEEKFDYNGEKVFDVHYKMKYNRFGWNYYPDPNRGMRYFRVFRNDGSGGPYDTTDFKYLFRPPLLT